MTGDALVERLRGFDSCIVSDALVKLSLKGTVFGIHRVWPCGRIAGRIVTVKLVPYDEAGAAGAPHLGARAIEAASPGDVIVVANDGRIENASWGGLLSIGAVQRGVAGTIVDGACRDVDESMELGYPVFARTAVPMTARGIVMEAATNVEVVIADADVAPGDLAIADGSGVVFVPADRADDVLEVAGELFARERGIAEGLRAGGAPTEVMGRHYERMLAPEA